ncbi:hypothetical protein BFR35_05070 [Brochothrix thermosphacta]|uniref:hypothetical protein n=1 Tax=Brochothrix thermosphacta TaxID=2756 RepID=UPI0004907742|nr:hypothetical protein [Brochothrix thermosphacta]ODJ50875.1 hypothetical protein BFR34_02280 [Brochothrix thermosphacta DSM 20171 = FSL F6-1036]ANZ95049.1 hypothetical protein BFC19_06485 [Brochothrix thermosphacta]ODJ56855.1 hypothetical protein BFR41_11495 [Brochothrix thermosphacta]ODJ65215.1 hypothetical protein BFR36_09340 [Brochothrix thermosphacta]ODJ67663.1 hypothetical protein BFR35_05070 [Brochothrix thermosphacta]
MPITGERNLAVPTKMLKWEVAIHPAALSWRLYWKFPWNMLGQQAKRRENNGKTTNSYSFKSL